MTAPCAAGKFHSWLIGRGSLTARIEARSPGMTVKVLLQKRRRPNRDERFLARRGVRGTLALTRDVLLCCGNTPVVYAHSVLAPGNGGAGGRLMQGMGTRPLGAALFTDPRICRGRLHQRRLGRGHELYRQISRTVKPEHRQAAYWARRSLFMVGKSPILVTEVFLPGVLAI